MTIVDRLSIPSVSHGPAASRTRRDVGIATALCVILSVGLGLLASGENSSKLIEVLFVGAIVGALVWRFGLGLWLALLTLGAVDALPGPKLESIEAPVLHVNLCDTLIIVMIITLFVENLRDDFARVANTPVRRALCIWSGIFLLVWGVTVARSYVWDGITLKHALYFGRDFAFFALLLPLFAATVTRPRIRQVMLASLGIAIVFVELTEIASILGHKSLSFFVHAQTINESNGVNRLYVNAQYLEVVAAMLGFGLLLLARTPRLRLAGAIVAPLSVLAVALELTRAQYIGGAVGLTVGLIVWLLFNRRSGRFGRRHLTRLAIVLLAFAAVLIANPFPQVSGKALSVIESRVSSVFSTLASNNAAASTVAYREIEASQLEQVLGSKWIFGLGFLDPRDHYVLGIRNGSIRNGDVGVLNAVMTMGLLGAILLYLPPVFILLGLIRSAVKRSEPPDKSWIAFGIAAWTVSVLTTSLTLISLFSAPGLCIAALSLGLGANILASDRARAPERHRRLAWTNRPPHTLLHHTGGS
jgi:hypothetical protein